MSSRPYFWFVGESVSKLFAAMTQIGPTNARVEVHTSADGQHAHFLVKDVTASSPAAATADDCVPINESHLCPPDCG